MEKLSQLLMKIQSQYKKQPDEILVNEKYLDELGIKFTQKFVLGEQDVLGEFNGIKLRIDNNVEEFDLVYKGVM